MPPLPEAFRGEVWDVAFPGAGAHPAVVLSISGMNARLGHVVVVPVTGTAGPTATHIPLDADAGLTRHPVSDADVTGVQAVDRARLRRRRGRLSAAELERLGEQLQTYLGF